MIRATTPIHSFFFEDDPEQYVTILITYAQGKTVVLEKNKEDLTFEPADENGPCGEQPAYRAWFRLTQEETKRFTCGTGQPVYVQVRAVTDIGEAIASEKKLIQIQDVLDDREL